MKENAFRRLTESIARLELGYRAFDLFPMPVAVWLVHTAAGFVLIDCGPPETAQDLLQAIEDATDGQGIQAVILTHAHYDHAGGLEELRLAWNPAVICHVGEAPFLQGEKSYTQLTSFNPAFLMGRYLLDSLDSTIPPTHTVSEGQAVFEMAVVPLPGHTPGHMGLLHQKERALICGDGIMRLFKRWGPPSALVTHQPALSKRALRRIRNLPFDHLLPSHGPPIMNEGPQVLAKILGEKAPSQ